MTIHRTKIIKKNKVYFFFFSIIEKIDKRNVFVQNEEYATNVCVNFILYKKKIPDYLNHD
jgi:hypothetical protein